MVLGRYLMLGHLDPYGKDPNRNRKRILSVDTGNMLICFWYSFFCYLDFLGIRVLFCTPATPCKKLLPLLKFEADCYRAPL